MRQVWVFGAGGHAKVVIDTLRAAGDVEIAGVLDDDPSRWGGEVLGVSIRGGLSDESMERFGVERAVVAIGSNPVRAEVVGRLAGRIAWVSAVHPRAYLAGGVRIGEGAVVFAGAIVQPDTAVGAHAILNTGCSVDHDGVVGPFAHVAPGARLAGGIRVGTGALVGIGSTVLPGCAIGDWSVVGAGGVVCRDVPPGVTVRGVPARSL